MNNMSIMCNQQETKKIDIKYWICKIQIQNLNFQKKYSTRVERIVRFTFIRNSTKNIRLVWRIEQNEKNQVKIIEELKFYEK